MLPHTTHHPIYRGWQLGCLIRSVHDGCSVVAEPMSMKGGLDARDRGGRNGIVTALQKPSD